MQLNSESVLKGAERAPNRSLFYALGYTDEEINRPLIGVVSAYSEIVPGHAHLDKLAEAVKAGVRMAGGTPILVPSIGVCDGIAMGHIGMKYSLPSRELICDSVETMARAHGFDGLVLVPNCDKIVPGMLMAAARLNIPSIVVSGGPMLSGRQGTRHVSLSQMFEAVGSYKAGIIGEDVLDDYTKKHLSRLRQLLRYVHRQQHELPVRGHRHGAAGQRHDPRRVRGAHAAGKARGHAYHGSGAGRGASPGYSDAGGIQKCTGYGYGAGLQFQQRFAPAGHCQRGGCAYEPGDFQ